MWKYTDNSLPPCAGEGWGGGEHYRFPPLSLALSPRRGEREFSMIGVWYAAPHEC